MFLRFVLDHVLRTNLCRNALKRLVRAPAVDRSDSADQFLLILNRNAFCRSLSQTVQRPGQFGRNSRFARTCSTKVGRSTCSHRRPVTRSNVDGSRSSSHTLFILLSINSFIQHLKAVRLEQYRVALSENLTASLSGSLKKLAHPLAGVIILRILQYAAELQQG